MNEHTMTSDEYRAEFEGCNDPCAWLGRLLVDELDRYREALEKIVEPANADQTSAEYASWVFKVATQALSANPSETGV